MAISVYNAPGAKFMLNSQNLIFECCWLMSSGCPILNAYPEMRRLRERAQSLQPFINQSSPLGDLGVVLWVDTPGELQRWLVSFRRL